MRAIQYLILSLLAAMVAISLFCIFAGAPPRWYWYLLFGESFVGLVVCLVACSWYRRKKAG